MNFLDIIFLIPVIWFAWRGFRHGLIIELATLAALILGAFAAFYFSGYISGWIVKNFTFSEGTATVISYFVTFILVFIAVYILGKILEKVIDIIALGFLNKLLGLVFGVIKAFILISVGLALINHYNEKIISEETRKGSLIYEYIAPISEFLRVSIENVETRNPGNAVSADTIIYKAEIPYIELL